MLWASYLLPPLGRFKATISLPLPFFLFSSERELTQFSKAPGNGGGLGLGEVSWFCSLTRAPTVPRGMSSTLARNEEKKGSRPSQPTTPATSLGCDLVSPGEGFLGWG